METIPKDEEQELQILMANLEYDDVLSTLSTIFVYQLTPNLLTMLSYK